METPKISKIPSTLFYSRLNKDTPLPPLKKLLPKYFLSVDLTWWELNSRNYDREVFNILKHQKTLKTLKFNLDEYKNKKFFVKCLKQLRSSAKNVESQKSNPLISVQKSKTHQFLGSRITFMSIESSSVSLKLMRRQKSLTHITITLTSTSNYTSQSFFKQLASTLKRMPNIKVCSLRNIRYKEQTLQEILDLVHCTQTSLNFILEIIEMPLTVAPHFLTIKERIKLHTKLSLIDQNLRADQDFSFVERVEMALRFGLNLPEISNVMFLGYLSNLRHLDLAIRLRDLSSTNEFDLLRILKFPQRLETLNLELHDLLLVTKGLGKNPQMLLKRFGDIEKAIQAVQNEDPLNNLIREVEGLKSLHSFKLTFSGDQDNPLFNLLTYAFASKLPNITSLHVIIEISRSLMGAPQHYYELNLTFLLNFMMHPEELKQLLISIPIIGFRQVETIPELKAIEKVFLHCSKEYSNQTDHSECAERIFEMLATTKVRDVYYYFMNTLIDEEWLKDFIESDRFNYIERIFICSGMDQISVDLLEAFCFFLNEKRMLTKIVLNLPKCSINIGDLQPCLRFFEDTKKLSYGLISVRNGSVVNNKALKDGSRLTFNE